MELHSGLFPISSRTLVGRLRDMERISCSSALTLAAILRTSSIGAHERGRPALALR